MEGQNLKHICKFCKKGFACGRSLGGHIRTHLPKPGSYELRENPKKTWRVVADHGGGGILNSSSSPQSTSSSSEAETRTGKLSRVHQSPGIKRPSLVVGNNSYSSVSEVVEGEQEEEVAIAMCLIMLSRDMGPWEGLRLAQGNNNNNCKNKRKRREKVQGKLKETVFTTAVNGDQDLPSGYLQKGLKLKGIEGLGNGFGSKDQISKRKEVIFQGDHSSKEHEVSEHHNNIKVVRTGFFRKEDFDVSENDQSRNYHEFGASDDAAMKSELLNRTITSNNKICSKRSKFECTTCNKVFHSYQALGGHKASHKKLLLSGVKDSCCQPKRAEKEAITISDSPPTQIGDEEPSQQNDQIVTDIIGKKAVQKHKCPICYRVFSSGQALGGHKRSHLLAASNNAENNGKNSETNISQSSKSVDVTAERSSSSDTRDLMLDLNFPPATVHQEDHTTTTTSMTTASSSNSLVGLIKPYWWVENPHNHDSLLSLISN